jgi:hypothetical protein
MIIEQMSLRGVACLPKRQRRQEVIHRLSIIFAIITALCAGHSFAQMVVNKSIYGQIYSAEFTVNAKTDTVLKRLGDIDSLARIMGCLNRGGPSKKFARVGDAAMFIPYFNNKNRDYGIVMLTFINVLAEMRFTYQSMNGEDFFQDLYRFSPSGNNSAKISFVKRYVASDSQSPEQIADRTKLVEDCLARMKAMVEGK